jgi:hypothetical protein
MLFLSYGKQFETQNALRKSDTYFSSYPQLSTQTSAISVDNLLQVQGKAWGWHIACPQQKIKVWRKISRP